MTDPCGTQIRCLDGQGVSLADVRAWKSTPPPEVALPLHAFVLAVDLEDRPLRLGLPPRRVAVHLEESFDLGRYPAQPVTRVPAARAGICQDRQQMLWTARYLSPDLPGQARHVAKDLEQDQRSGRRSTSDLDVRAFGDVGLFHIHLANGMELVREAFLVHRRIF